MYVGRWRRKGGLGQGDALFCLVIELHNYYTRKAIVSMSMIVYYRIYVTKLYQSFLHVSLCNIKLPFSNATPVSVQ